MSTYRGIPLPTGRTMNASELSQWKKGADAVLDVVRPMLDAVTYDTPCSLDHHGYCQEHGHLEEGPCPDGTARLFLEASSLDAFVWRKGHAFYWCAGHRPAGTSTTRETIASIHPSVPLVCTHCGRAVR